MNQIQISDKAWQLLKKGTSRAFFVPDVPVSIFLKSKANAANEIMLCNANKEVVAYTDIESIFLLNYEADVNQIDEATLKYELIAQHRNEALKKLYYEWCIQTDEVFNSFEGWYKSKNFQTYLNEIGWGSNYCIFIKNLYPLTYNGGLSYDEIALRI